VKATSSLTPATCAALGWLASACSSGSPAAVDAATADSSPGDGSADVTAPGPDAPPDTVAPLSQASCTAVRSPMVNPDFEAPAHDGIMPGWTVETSGGASVGWDPVGGYAGSAALSVRVPDDASGATAVVKQTLQLDPNTAYLFYGRVAVENSHSRGDDPLLFQLTVRNGTRSWTTGPAKSDSGDIDFRTYPPSLPLDLATGSEGRVDIELRTSSSGHFLVDQLVLQCNPQVKRFSSRRLVANIHDAISAPPEVIQQTLGTMDRFLDDLAALTGAPDVGTDRLSSVASRSAATTQQLRGDPVVWPVPSSNPSWSQPGFLVLPLASALARDFDRPAWLFDDGFADLYVYHAVESLDLLAGTDPAADRGRGYRARFENAYKRSWVTNKCADTDGLIYKHLLIRDQVGWEPFQSAFRILAALPPDSPKPAPWALFRRWIDYLGRSAGMDVWSTFSAQEQALLASRYDRPAPAPVSLGQIPATTSVASLAGAVWQSGLAGGDPPTRNGLPNSCPMTTAGGVQQPLGLYARALSQYVFDLGGTWKTFSASYALQADQAGSVLFRVRGDGKELFRSTAVNGAQPHALEVDVTGVHRLELLVNDTGADVSRGMGLWLDPRLGR
jgi:hypothetical protein